MKTDETGTTLAGLAECVECARLLVSDGERRSGVCERCNEGREYVAAAQIDAWEPGRGDEGRGGSR